MLSACNGIRSGPSVLGLDTVVRSCPIAQMCAPGARRFNHVIWPVRHTDTDRITRGETRATRAHTGSALEDGDDDNPQGGGSQAPRKSASRVPKAARTRDTQTIGHQAPASSAPFTWDVIRSPARMALQNSKKNAACLCSSACRQMAPARKVSCGRQTRQKVGGSGAGLRTGWGVSLTSEGPGGIVRSNLELCA